MASTTTDSESKVNDFESQSFYCCDRHKVLLRYRGQDITQVDGELTGFTLDRFHQACEHLDEEVRTNKVTLLSHPSYTLKYLHHREDELARQLRTWQIQGYAIRVVNAAHKLELVKAQEVQAAKNTAQETKIATQSKQYVNKQFAIAEQGLRADLAHSKADRRLKDHQNSFAGLKHALELADQIDEIKHADRVKRRRITIQEEEEEEPSSLATAPAASSSSSSSLGGAGAPAQAGAPVFGPDSHGPGFQPAPAAQGPGSDDMLI